jgi:succinyl-diaminopimelate desuccinylase
MGGGLNTNSVPDFAEFTIDMRSTAQTSHADLRRDIRICLGPEAEFETVIDVPAVATNATDPFVLMAIAARGRRQGGETAPEAVAFYTDASVLQPHLGCPTIILGPGEPTMAHQTDEYCEVGQITGAHALYADMIREACEVD